MKNKKVNLVFSFLIYSGILLISHIISTYISLNWPQFPIPTALIGLVLLFILLTMGIIKLEYVEDVSNTLISIIGLLFVPSGISLVKSLDLLQKEGIKIIIVVIFSTIIILISVAYSTNLIIKISEKWTGRRFDEEN